MKIANRLSKGLIVAASLALLGPPAKADALADRPGMKVSPAIPLQARAFRLEDVRLLDGPFKQAMELDRQYLLALDADRLLHTFRLHAGLPSSAAPLGGWEEPAGELRGHFTGHYLTACALMYASTGDARLRQRADYITTELAKCQEALRSGYLSAYPEEFFDRVEAGQRVWAPYYTLHKIYAGLLDVYDYCGNRQALEVCRRFADWVIARNAKLTDERMQDMLDTEHGGMNEVLASLYGVTAERKYLEIAQRFNHRAVLGPPAQRQDRLTGLHANTQIPKFIGTARQYELTGQPWLRAASVFFWDTVVNERSYVIGGHSDGEIFSPKEKLSEALGPNTTETCNTYNLLKLTRHLFCWDPKAEYADYYERALYNHILASQNPQTGMMCYYVPLRSGSRKTYNDPERSFWCCTGTGIENHAKYGDSIYFHSDTTLWVNLFIASELDWKAKGLKLRQETGYPEEGNTCLRFTCSTPVELSLNVRHPCWASQGASQRSISRWGPQFEVQVNGRRMTPASTPGSYVTIQRTWTDGDRVEVRMPFTLRTEGFRDNPHRLAFLHGPLVLCAEVDPAQMCPTLVADPEKLVSLLQAVPGKPSVFTGPQSAFRIPGQGHAKPAVLEPFYRMHGARHYMVYWDVFTEEQWQVKEERYRTELARQKELEERTVDHVLPGNPQNERDHHLMGENTGAGDFSERKWRHATDGGWFSYVVKVLPDLPAELSVTYWGSDGGNRVFDVLVDGVKVATERLENNRPGEFYDQAYPIPRALTGGKDKVTVKWQAHPGAWAGGVFGLRVLQAGKDAERPDAPAHEAPTRSRRDVTFLVTSDVHYDAFENEDRNDRVRDTLRQMNAVATITWPDELGGGSVGPPRGVLVLGDVIDDGDRVFQGKHQTPRQWLLFEADFGLDGADGLLNWPVCEGWGNHDGPPVGAEKHGFSFQAQLQRRNHIRRQQGRLTNLSANALHYSWDWDEVHFVQLGIYPADRQHRQVKYSPAWHDPQGALTFLRQDLAAHVGDSGRPVVLMSHCGFDTNWWHEDDWKGAYDAARPYNVVLYLYGHTGTGLRRWAPPGEDTRWQCVNTGQTENGFFVVQITDREVRLAYRTKKWLSEETTTAKTIRRWDGTWQWKHLFREPLQVAGANHTNSNRTE